MLNETHFSVVEQDGKKYLLLEKKVYLMQEIEGEVTEESLLSSAEKLKGRAQGSYNAYAKRDIKDCLRNL